MQACMRKKKNNLLFFFLVAHARLRVEQPPNVTTVLALQWVTSGS